MRHQKAGVKLGRTSSHRKAMFRNMVTSLFKFERIRTTDAKAKALRGWVDHVITLAKRGDLHARRQVLSIIREKAVVHKLFAEAPERFGEISGGYTRVVKVGRRPGDAAAISLVELVGGGAGVKPKKTSSAPKTTAAPVPVPAESAPPAAGAPVAEPSSEEPAGPETAASAEMTEETAEDRPLTETASSESDEATSSEESTGAKPEDTDTRKNE